jgi:hypothetical protein
MKRGSSIVPKLRIASQDAVVGEHRSAVEAIPEGVVEVLRELMPI